MSKLTDSLAPGKAFNVSRADALIVVESYRDGSESAQRHSFATINSAQGKYFINAASQEYGLCKVEEGDVKHPYRDVIVSSAVQRYLKPPQNIKVPYPLSSACDGQLCIVNEDEF
eukprot:12415273-Karenia_brevis.AAC.1